MTLTRFIIYGTKRKNDRFSLHAHYIFVRLIIQVLSGHFVVMKLKDCGSFIL